MDNHLKYKFPHRLLARTTSLETHPHVFYANKI